MVVWNLDHLHKMEDLDDFIKEIQSKVNKLKSYNGKLENISPKQFIKLLELDEEIDEKMSRLFVRASLKFTENTADPKAAAHKAKVSNLITDWANDLLFLSHWFKRLPDKKAKPFLDDAGDFRYSLTRIRQFKPYSLKESEEKIINLKDLTGAEAQDKLYDIITNRYTFNWDGKEISQEEIGPFKQSPDRKKRKKAYDLTWERYKYDIPVLGELYRNIVTDWHNENIKLRGFKSPISVRNQGNDIPDDAVQSMLDVVRENAGIFREYFKLKSKILKLKKFDRYDLYAPYSPKEAEHPFNDTKKLVLDTYKKFSPKMYEKAKAIFDDKHVHSDLTPNKQSGAFCWPATNQVPAYILLNHTNKLRDVFTMMHEFGHGIHDGLASKQRFCNYGSSLPLAETASLFGEMLMASRMLKEADHEEKIATLILILDEQYASVVRQAFFVLFEIQAHEAIAKGATNEELCDMYMANLKEQFGDMPIDEGFRYEWTYIPHIYGTPFYCYSYAFGMLLVLALFRMYKEEGDSFIPKYIKILESGQSKPPADILKEVGIDITSKKFWQAGFDVIREELDELMNLVN